MNSLQVRWARLLVWLYPPSFRKRFGAEMVEVFLAEARARGGFGLGALRFWLGASVSAARCAMAEY